MSNNLKALTNLRLLDIYILQEEIFPIFYLRLFLTLTEIHMYCTIMYNMVQKIDVSKARSTLTKLMEKAYFRGEEFILLRRGIPMAIVSSINKSVRTPEAAKTYGKKEVTRLFGIWKNKKGSTIKIADHLREIAWRRHAY